MDPVVVTEAPTPYISLPFYAANALEGEMAGTEIGLAWQAHHAWRLRANYALTAIDPWPVDRAVPLLDVEWQQEEDNTPLHQLQLISWLSLGRRWEFDNAVTTYSRNHGQDVASWVRWDARIGWRLSSEVELSVIWQNLLRSQHFEWQGNIGEIRDLPGRTFFVGLDWSLD